MDEATTCPYCSHPLAKVPTRKSKCPHCGESIHVKRPFGAPDKVLMTAERAAQEEAKWSASQDRDSALRELDLFGLTESDLDQAAAGLRPGGSVWDAVRHLVENASRGSRDLHQLKLAQLTLANVARRQDRDPVRHLEALQRLELEELKRSGVVIAVTVRKPRPGPYGEDPRVGPQCESRIDRRFGIDEAMTEMPLPCGPNCVCMYAPVLEGE